MTVARFSAAPAAVGLYDGQHEHDACGVAFVATMRGEAGHDIVEHALTALRNLDHRGATGADPTRGDGAGILTQIPDAFLREVRRLRPARGRRLRGRAWPSCPTDAAERARRRGARSRPSPPRRACASSAGATSRSPPSWSGRPRATACRVFRQLFVAAGAGRVGRGIALDRLAFCLRKRAEREAERLLPLAVRPHPGLQGHAHHRPARAVLPRPVRPPLRHRAGAGPLAVLDQHLPVAGRWPTPTG